SSAQLFVGDPERQQARRLHLRLKGDLARAWLYACAPSTDLLSKLPPREDALPPALWFAPLAPTSFRLWQQYDPDGFGRLVEHSLKPHRNHERVANWLAELKKSRQLA